MSNSIEIVNNSMGDRMRGSMSNSTEIVNHNGMSNNNMTNLLFILNVSNMCIFKSIDKIPVN